MSCQKGNAARTRSQKHCNRTAFKNNLHDTSHQTKQINSIQVCGVCTRCKEIIEWKIKYKKYKPLTQPKKCVKCDGRTVKKAYHVMCQDCGRKLGVCTKCCQSKEVVPPVPSKEDLVKLDNEMKALLKTLPERRRRTFLRFMQQQDETKDTLSKKLEELRVADDNDFDEEDDFDDDDFSDDS